MKQKAKSLLIGSVLLGSQAVAAKQGSLSLKELTVLGINDSVVFREFLTQHGIQLSPDQLIAVSYEKEGEELTFETLDKISVTVPLDTALGVPNKEPWLPK